MAAPLAPRHPHRVPSPWGERDDEFYWLRDDQRQNPEMLAYLTAENAHTAEVLAPTEALQEKIYQELRQRINEDDSSLPYFSRGHWYYRRLVAGQDYPIFARRPEAPDRDALSLDNQNRAGDFGDEQILLNVNELARGHDYYSAHIGAIEPQQQIMAWFADHNGRRQYQLHFTELASGEERRARFSRCDGDGVWAEDGASFYFIENDPETLLSKRVYRYDYPRDRVELVYEEPDDSCYLSLEKTRDRQFILIHSSNTLSDEVRYTSASAPGEFRVFRPREERLEYGLDHFQGRWYIRTNADGAVNFKIMTAASAEAPWQEWQPHQAEVLNYGVELFDDFAVISECSEALPRLKILKPDGSSFYLAGDEDCSSLGLSANPEASSEWLRYSYSSMITPPRIYEIHIASGEKRLLKEQEVKNYDRSQYRTERRWIQARDGVKIPVSLVYHRDTTGPAPLLQYGYGSYGQALFPDFNGGLVSLLDRGLIYAIAHVRGGEELGRQWYEQGRLEHKWNTFNDFIDVSAGLVAEGLAAPDKILAMGGSAGGLLMGVIANVAPERYRAIVSQVPFVDALTTMLDPSIPLTTNEYDEWGNPTASRASYDYIRSYSPYDNIRAQAYPALLVTTGLWDSQVQYWEPAKYVARLRRYNTGTAPLLLKTNMEAGHGGKSGRYRRLRESAEVYAFLLWQLGQLD